MTIERHDAVSQALAHARRGWPVFPCQPGGKQPATRHGFLDASTDQGQISRWWRRRPDANLAIATGAPGPDVLDIDQHGQAGDGFAAYYRLLNAGLLDGVSSVVATPGGGLHLYFLGTAQSSGRLPARHLDFKAAGGYILAPPSQVGGRSYLLLEHQDRQAILNWPEVAGLLDPSRRRPGQPGQGPPADRARLAAWVRRLPEGNRNSGLFWAACRALEADPPGGPDDLDVLAAAAGRTGLDRDEISRTLASARRAMARDRSSQAG